MVSTYSEMLRRKFGGQLGPKGDEYIRYTVEGAQRMQQLLKDLLAYTQASVLGDEPAEDVDANQALQQALSNSACRDHHNRSASYARRSPSGPNAPVPTGAGVSKSYRKCYPVSS